MRYRATFGNCAASAFAWAAFGPLGASFKYVSNSAPRPFEIAFVHERHAELIVRFGMIRLGRDHLLELHLRVGDFTCVPQNRRPGCTARRDSRRRPASSPTARPPVCRLPGASSNFRCTGVDVHESVVRLGSGLHFDRLLVRLFRLRVILLLRVRDADVVVAVGALRVGLQRFHELGDRLVEVAGGARRDTLVECLAQPSPAVMPSTKLAGTRPPRTLTFPFVEPDAFLRTVMV